LCVYGRPFRDRAAAHLPSPRRPPPSPRPSASAPRT
jgi:hypothetical protein